MDGETRPELVADALNLAEADVARLCDDVTNDEFPLAIVRVRRADADNGDLPELLGRGVRFPSGKIVIEWNNAAFPEDQRLDGAHHSIYDSVGDYETAHSDDIDITRIV